MRLLESAQPSLTISVDASLMGAWGMLSKEAYYLTYRHWFQSLSLPMNLWKPSTHCLTSHFFDKIRGYDITLETDNTAAQQSLSNLSARNGAFRLVACKVVMLITAADAKLTTRQVPGETLLSKGGRSLTLLYRNQLRQAHSGSEGYRSQCLPSP